MIAVDQVSEVARGGEQSEMSGEEGLPEEGRRVGKEELRTTRGLDWMTGARSLPLSFSPGSSQRGLRALKSPMMIAFGRERMGEMSTLVGAVGGGGM